MNPELTTPAPLPLQAPEVSPWRRLAAVGALGGMLLAGCSTSAERPPAAAVAPQSSGAEAPVSAAPSETVEANEQAPNTMLFVGIPRDAEEAKAQATELAGTLKDAANRGERPMVIIEPTHNGGDEKADLKRLAADKGISGLWKTYFGTLKEAGITDKDIAITPYSEPNIPEWKDGVTSPDVFKANFTAVGAAFKEAFPGGNLSLLLNRTSCPDGDVDWAHATNDIETLKRYTDGLPTGMVDSFGLQGFTWEPGDNPADFVGADAATAVAGSLGGPKTIAVWLNTGTFTQRKEDGRVIKQTAAQRREALLGEIEQARKVQQAGYQVSIIFFGENKFNTEEAVDWTIDDLLSEAKRAAGGIPVGVFRGQ